MKGRLILGIGCTLVLTAAVTTGVQHLRERPALESNVLLRNIPSRILGEQREIVVHLPESYDRSPDQRYPVVYVLDGSSEDGHTAASASLMARIDVMPEVIVVGLPNTSAANRERDYTPPFMRRDVEESTSPLGAGDRFIAFLKSEAIPWVEREYRAASIRLLVGRSRGGLLVVYSLISDPALFDARFAFSPALWRDDGVVVAKLRDALGSSAETDTFLYMSMGDQENEKMMRAYQSAVATLQERAPRWLRWRADLTPGADHETNARLSTPVAFSALYTDRQQHAASPMGQSSAAPAGQVGR